MEDVIMRGWENFLARTTGPMHLRFLIQPSVAAFIAIRAGLQDARLEKPAFFWSLLTKTGQREAHLSEILAGIGKVLVIASILDVIYQLREQRGVYALELVFTVITLAIVPYLLLRGPVNRLASWLHTKRLQRV